MRVELMVTSLVTRARDGDQQAWDAIVERYAPLMWSICRSYRLGRADTDDVAQTVWLQLVTYLGTLRNPAALGAWLATTTRHECARASRTPRSDRAAVREADTLLDAAAGPADAALLAAEQHAVLRQAFACLSPGGRQLLALLIEDPPLSYAQIAARLGIPVGSIGPTRRRCLEKVRRHPAVAALIRADGPVACRPKAS